MKKIYLIYIVCILSIGTIAGCDTKDLPISDISREEVEELSDCPGCSFAEVKKKIKPIVGKRVRWTNEIASIFKEPAFDRKDWIVVVWVVDGKEDVRDYQPCILEGIPHEVIDGLESRDIITFEGTITGQNDIDMFHWWLLKDVEIISVND